jgi:hypothetical protein
MDLDQLYDNFKHLINDLSPEEMQRETDRAIRESRDAYIMEGEDDE